MAIVEESMSGWKRHGMNDYAICTELQRRDRWRTRSLQAFSVSIAGSSREMGVKR